MLLNPPDQSAHFTSNVNMDPNNGQVLLASIDSKPKSSIIRSGVGMTKQELMKYANDPFWVRLRTFLFVLFWIIWFAMLIGSIVIVAMAPGCPVTSSLPWWKKSSIINLELDKIDSDNRNSYASKLTDQFGEIESNLDKLAKMHVNTLVVGDLDPYILLPNPADDNTTENEIDKLRNKITSLARNGDDIKVVMGLDLHKIPKSYVQNKINDSEPNDIYIESKTPSPDLKPNEVFLNYSSSKAQELFRKAVLAWMKTKIEGIKAGSIYESVNNEIKPSKQAESDLLKAIKAAGQNKILIHTAQDLPKNVFDENDAANNSDMAPDRTFWTSFANDFKSPKESLAKIFEPYVQQEQRLLSENNTDNESLTNRENVGKFWRTFLIQHPNDPVNIIEKKSDRAITEAVIMAIYMMPKVTLITQMDLKLLNQKNSEIVDRMMKLRQEHPETMLAGRTILPKIKGSDSIFALYRGSKTDNGYLLLINEANSKTVANLDVNELPFQENVLSRKVLLTNSENTLNNVDADVSLDSINLDPKQSMIIEFNVK
ncbi:Alpha amylase-like protein [Sarcoptes scabiei]|uniref:Alpha amylase-like protein n=1 Tax=Sarcoptes scabiei TaxID=52283 RepID=A0A132AI80_SARSC|nr:Alpha amylase-like protein [Sarcoptes scabiei]